MVLYQVCIEISKLGVGCQTGSADGMQTESVGFDAQQIRPSPCYDPETGCLKILKTVLLLFSTSFQLFDKNLRIEKIQILIFDQLLCFLQHNYEYNV